MSNIKVLPFVALTATTSQDGACFLEIGFLSTGAAIDISNINFCVQWMTVTELGLPDQYDVAIDASTTGNYITSGDVSGVLSCLIPKSKMGSLAPGTYIGDLIANDGEFEFVVGQITLIHSNFGPCVITSMTTTPRNVASANSVGYVPGPGWNQYKLNYSTSTNYVTNDVVYYNFSTWIALQNSVNQAPAVGPYWNLVAPGVNPADLDAAVAAAAASAASAAETIANIGAAIAAYIASLPTTLPATSGQPWLNEGVFEIS